MKKVFLLTLILILSGCSSANNEADSALIPYEEGEACKKQCMGVYKDSGWSSEVLKECFDECIENLK